MSGKVPIVPFYADIQYIEGESIITFSDVNDLNIVFTLPYAVSDGVLTLSLINDVEILFSAHIIGNKMVPIMPIVRKCPGTLFWFEPKPSMSGQAKISISSANAVAQYIYFNGSWRWMPLTKISNTPPTWRIDQPFQCLFCIS